MPARSTGPTRPRPGPRPSSGASSPTRGWGSTAASSSAASSSRSGPSRPRLPAAMAAAAPSGGVLGFTTTEWKRIAAMAVFFVLAAIFWGAYEQAGSSLNLFGGRYTTLRILGRNFPSSWYVSVQAIFVIILAPAFAWLWIRLGKYEPTTPTKFAFGLFFVGLSFVFLLIPAAPIQ